GAYQEGAASSQALLLVEDSKALSDLAVRPEIGKQLALIRVSIRPGPQGVNRIARDHQSVEAVDVRKVLGVPQIYQFVGAGIRKGEGQEHHQHRAAPVVG